MQQRRLIVVLVLVALLVVAVPVQAHYVGLIYYPPARGEDGSLYVSGTDGILYALDANGEPRWTYNASAELTTRAELTDGLVLAGTVDGRVVATRASDGTERWTTRLAGTDRRRVRSVVAGDRTAYAATRETVHALDRQRGTERWTFPVAGRVSAGPATTGEGAYVGASTRSNGTLYALTPAGERRWTRSYDAPIDALAAGPDGTAYVGTNDTLRAVSAGGDELWAVEVGEVWQPPAVEGSRVVVGTFDGRLVAVEDGSIRWTYDAGEAAAPAFGPDGDRVYAVAPRAVVAVEDGRRQWRAETGTTLLVAPTVGPSRVYVGTQVNRTYALSRDGSVAWIDRYATPFGAFVGVPGDAEPPEFLADVPGTPTRVVSKDASVREPEAASDRRGVAPGAGLSIAALVLLAGLVVGLHRLRN